MAEIDAFVCAIPTENCRRFQHHTEDAAAVFKEHGGLKFVECSGDAAPEGEITSFPKAVQEKDDETVVFGWTLWPSRDARRPQRFGEAAWQGIIALLAVERKWRK